jgi:ABC-2 type transport system permease protein
MMRVLGAEFVKLRRAPMVLWTAFVVLFISALDLAMLPVVTRPDVVRKIAASGGRFAAGAAAGAYARTWTNLLHFGAQGIAGSWGILTFGLVAAYVFGREYREGSAPTMLTLPLRREYVVLAKLVVLAVWVLALTLLSAALLVAVVAVLGAGGFAWTVVLTSFADSLNVSALLFLTLPVVAWFAMLGRGYLPPMLFSLAMMMLGSGLIGTTWSRWFPWNLPMHLVGASYVPVPLGGLTPGSVMVSIVVFLVGIAALIWQVDHADSTR